MNNSKSKIIIMYIGIVIIVITLILAIIALFVEEKTTKYYFTELDVVLDCKLYSGGASYRFKCYDDGEEIDIYTNSFIELEDYEKIQMIKNS